MAALLVFIPVHVFFEGRSVKAQFRETIDLWENQIAAAVFQNDSVFLEKMARNLLSGSLTRATIRTTDGLSATYPDSIDSLSCLLPTEVPVRRYGVPVATVTGCFSVGNIIRNSVLSPMVFILLGILFWLGMIVRNDLAISRSTRRLARQVAHDIRSPLLALDIATGDWDKLGEKEKALVRSALHRIHEIANQLLRKDPHLTRAITLKGERIHPLLEAIVDEKKMEYRSRRGIAIALECAEGVDALRARIDAVEFKRLISNLVNNSVESIPNEGFILVRLGSVGSAIQLEVQDTGCGIPEEIQERLFIEEISHGKSGGTGLGLLHAKTQIESWGGQLEIESSARGTLVRIANGRDVSLGKRESRRRFDRR